MGLNICMTSSIEEMELKRSSQKRNGTWIVLHVSIPSIVTKKDGPTETHSPNGLPAPGPWTSQPLTVRLTFMGIHPTSNHHLSTADLTVIRQTHQGIARLGTHLSQDLLTQTHHQNVCISFTICTYSESSSSFLQHKNDNSDRSGSSRLPPTSSTLLQHEPSYLSDTAENPRHSRSSELQSSSLLKSFYSSPKSSRSPPT
jgi:hypothetical protein